MSAPATVCSYCAYFAGLRTTAALPRTTHNPTAAHLASHPVNAVRIPTS